MIAGLGEMEHPWSVCTCELLGRNSSGRSEGNTKIKIVVRWWNLKLFFWNSEGGIERPSAEKCDLTRRIRDVPIQTFVGNIGYPPWVLSVNPVRCNGMIFRVSPYSHPLIYRHPIASYCLFVCFWRNSPPWARTSSFLRFLDHKQRRTTVGRTPVDEWLARRRDFCLITHNTQDWQTSMPPGDSNHSHSRRAAADLRLKTARPLGPA